MAAKIRRELGIEVEMIHGHYGEFKVLVDGRTVVERGPLSMVGILPSARKILETVRGQLTG